MADPSTTSSVFARRTLILDAFERAFEDSASGRAVIEAVDYARKNGYPKEGFEMRAAVAQAFRELERQGLISIPAPAPPDEPKPGPYDVISLDEFMALKREALDGFVTEYRKQHGADPEHNPLRKHLVAWIGTFMCMEPMLVEKEDIWPHHKQGDKP